MQVRKIGLGKANQLQQGSIFEIAGLVLEHGNKPIPLQEFYPYIDLKDIRYGIVISQSCDLYRSDGVGEAKRVPEIPYISVGFLDPFARYIQSEGVDWKKAKSTLLGPGEEDDKDIEWTIVSNFRLNEILAKTFRKLIQNNEKHHFFISLPDQPLDFRYFVLNITKAVPLRISHYDAMLKQVDYQLVKEFEDKLGWKLAELYGRVGTRDYKDDELNAVVDDLVEVSASVLPKELNSEYLLRLSKADDGLFTRAKEVSSAGQKMSRESRTGLFLEIFAAASRGNSVPAQTSETSPVIAQDAVPIILDPSSSAQLLGGGLLAKGSQEQTEPSNAPPTESPVPKDREEQPGD